MMRPFASVEQLRAIAFLAVKMLSCPPALFKPAKERLKMAIYSWDIKRDTIVNSHRELGEFLKQQEEG